MSKYDQFLDEDITVTLELDDGPLECEVVTFFSVGAQDYVALLPRTGPDAESGNVYLYRCSIGKDGEPELGYIDDDEEYEAASDAFDEYLDSSEFDELVTDDDPDFE